MPTRNRPQWVQLAIEAWLAQSYPPNRLELLVAEDGAARSPLPNDARIRYFGQGGTIGAKRNFLCGQAAGEIIVHWDDDDWSAPGRIRQQVGTITAGAAVAGFHSMLFYEVASGRVWQYSYPAPYAIGTSLAYRRDWWCSYPFPELQVGEDNGFQFRARTRGRLASADAAGLMVARTLATGTSPRQLQSKQWREVSPDDLPTDFPRL